MSKIDLRSLKKNPKELRESISGMDPNTVREVQHVMQQYQGKSEESLIEELREIAARERAIGNLPNDKIDKISDMLAPMLSGAQQEQMQTMLKQLKNT